MVLHLFNLRFQKCALKKLPETVNYLLAMLSVISSTQRSIPKWLLESSDSSVTVETWRKKYRVVTETARRDLLALCDAGLLVRELDGRKAVFRVLREL